MNPKAPSFWMPLLLLWLAVHALLLAALLGLKFFLAKSAALALLLAAGLAFLFVRMEKRAPRSLTGVPGG